MPEIKDRKDAIIYLISVIVAFILCWYVLDLKSCCKDLDQHKKPEVIDQNILTYKVLEKKDISYSNVVRYVYRIEIDLNPNEQIPVHLVMRTARKIWEKYGALDDEFTIFVMLPKKYSNPDYANIAFARFIFTPEGLKEQKFIYDTLEKTVWDKK